MSDDSLDSIAGGALSDDSLEGIAGGASGENLSEL